MQEALSWCAYRGIFSLPDECTMFVSVFCEHSIGISALYETAFSIQWSLRMYVRVWNLFIFLNRSIVPIREILNSIFTTQSGVLHRVGANMVLSGYGETAIVRCTEGSSCSSAYPRKCSSLAGIAEYALVTTHIARFSRMSKKSRLHTPRPEK
jgi:hypothetical protein